MSTDPIPSLINSGRIGVLLTDTIYGLIGQALRVEVVNRIYKVRHRNPKKPCIVLIGKIGDLKYFDIKLNREERGVLKKIWPGTISIVFQLPNKKFYYLHRGLKSLAFRLPQSSRLQKIIKETGPLIAPSANPEGLSPAQSIPEAISYFGSTVDFYKDDGQPKTSKPSTLVEIKSLSKEINVLRKGSTNIKDLKRKIPKNWKVKTIS